jgi:hypothetical protein
MEEGERRVAICKEGKLHWNFSWFLLFSFGALYMFIINLPANLFSFLIVGVRFGINFGDL